MKKIFKKILLLASAFALAGGIGTINAMEIGTGYNGAKDGIYGGHIEVSPLPRTTVGAAVRHWKHGGNETDVYAKYKVDKHFSVGIGNRNYYDRDARIFGMVEGNANLIGPLNAYAGVLLSSQEQEYKAGVKLDLVPTALDVDVNYTWFNRDDTKDERGVGIGLNYHI